jgi:hypothetical protein
MSDELIGRRSRVRRALLVSGALAVMIASGLVVARWYGVPLRIIAVSGIAALMACLLVYMQLLSDVPLDFWDLFRDEKTSRMSMDKSITIACCCFGLWYVIVKATDATFDTTDKAGGFLRDLILIMVIYRGTKVGVQEVAEAYKSKPAAPPVAEVAQMNVNQPASVPAKPPNLPPAIRVGG